MLVAGGHFNVVLARRGSPTGRSAPFRRYAASGEINRRVEDPPSAIERVAVATADGRQDRLDGLTVEYEDWWCNVRASNTEPLLRLNVEARDEATLRDATDRMLGLIGGTA